jgi:ribose/xylose/arabinose/galactoside ABC-type transport system permease subunit
VRAAWANHPSEVRLIGALVALCLAFSLAYPNNFPTVENFTNMGQVGGILLVVAIGQMFAILVGGFDLSVASNMGFVSVASAIVMTEHGGLAAGIVVGIAAGLAIGLVNGIFIAGFGLSPFIVTLGMLTFLRAFGNELAHGAPIFGLPDDTQYLGQTGWGALPSPLGIGLILLVAVGILLTRSRAGLYVYAIGGSRDTCRAAGIPLVRYEVLAYVLCGGLAGIAGMMELSRVSIGYVTNGQGYDLLSIAAVVVGGTLIGGGKGSLTGVVLGVAVLTVLATGLNIAGLNEFYQKMVTGAVLVLAVLVSQLRTHGLRGRLGPLVRSAFLRNVRGGDAHRVERQRLIDRKEGV